jgi:hypothetical protein
MGAMDDPFAESVIAGFQILRAFTLWRVGEHASGPGRDRADPPITAWAAHYQTGWAYSIDGDGAFESSRPPVPPDASVLDAQVALVNLVSRITGREVEAVWTEVNADTWTATASFSS